MSKYQKGKIYKLTSEYTDKIYIGSTIKSLNQRFKNHMNDYQSWLNDNDKKYVTSSEIIFQGDAKIELIENYPCKSAKELWKKEQYYLDMNKEICVNTKNAYGLDIENEKAVQKYHQAKFNVIRTQRCRENPMHCIYCDTYFQRNRKLHENSKRHKQNVEFFNNLCNKL